MYNIKFVSILDELVNVSEIVKVRKTIFNNSNYIFVTMKDRQDSRGYDFPSQEILNYAFENLSDILTK